MHHSTDPPAQPRRSTTECLAGLVLPVAVAVRWRRPALLPVLRTLLPPLPTSARSDAAAVPPPWHLGRADSAPPVPLPHCQIGAYRRSATRLRQTFFRSAWWRGASGARSPPSSRGAANSAAARSLWLAAAAYNRAPIQSCI